jgi:hypothetical protein
MLYLFYAQAKLTVQKFIPLASLPFAGIEYNLRFILCITR